MHLQVGTQAIAFDWPRFSRWNIQAEFPGILSVRFDIHRTGWYNQHHHLL